MNECQTESMQIDGLGTWIPQRCTAQAVHDLSETRSTRGWPGVGMGWDGFLKGIKYRGQHGVGVGLHRISDRTEPLEITPDDSRQHPHERMDRDRRPAARL